MHLSHSRAGIRVRTQNQTKAFFVTIPPLIVVHLGPQWFCLPPLGPKHAQHYE